MRTVIYDEGGKGVLSKWSAAARYEDLVPGLVELCAGSEYVARSVACRALPGDGGSPGDQALATALLNAADAERVKLPGEVRQKLRAFVGTGGAPR